MIDGNLSVEAHYVHLWNDGLISMPGECGSKKLSISN